MKKVSLFLFVFLVGIFINGFAQTADPSDFFAGKWEISVMGTPQGDAKFVTELIRKDGKLTGELKDPSGARPAVPITKIEEEKEKLTIYFNTEQAGEIPIELTKQDDDHLKGNLMNMFEATALRLK
ncbi:hypothetical protein [Larkinella soli]|uniref:hypothetical protein n=1 Tax=Larkinella soli TaxID=1770527 RepID=UPI000FFCB7D0|nr:hypothetical protein [Larkinella soli]